MGAGASAGGIVMQASMQTARPAGSGADPGPARAPGSRRHRGTAWGVASGLLAVAGHRAWQDRRQLLPAAAVTLLAAVLAASGPIHSEASRIAGVREAVASAPPSANAIVVSAPADEVAADAGARAIAAALQPAESAVREGGASRTFSAPAGTGEDSLVEFMAAEGLADEATLVAGTWPAEPADAAAPIPVALPVGAAEGLGLGVGQEAVVSSRFAARDVRVQVAGTFRLLPEASAFEADDGLLREGTSESGGFTTYGPFVVNLPTLLDRIEPQDATLRWWGAMATDTLDPDDLDRIAVGVSALAADPVLDVDTGLATLLEDTRRDATQFGSTSAVALLQLLVVAVAALLLVGGALADDRRSQAALLRSRGAGAGSVALLAAGEAALFALPAAVLGPPLAVLLVTSIGRLPPPVGAGLDMPAIIPGVSWAAAAGAVVVCVIGLAISAALSARSLVAARARQTRPSVAAALQAGGDVVLIALATVAVVQLRRRDPSLGLDASLIMAPALGLVAVLAVGLRLLSRVLALLDVVAARWRGALPALGVRAAARRRGAAMRMVALPVLAVSTGVLALTTGASLQTALAERAAHVVGADLRGDVAGGSATQVDALDGIAAATAVWSAPIPAAGDLPAGRFVAVDAETAGQVVALRSDLAEGSWTASLAQLAALRPDVPAVAVPDGAAAVVARIRGDADLAQDVRLTLVLRDGDGLYHRVAAPLGPGQARAALPAGIGWAVAGIEVATAHGDAASEPLSLVIEGLQTDEGPELDVPAGWRWQEIAVRDVIVAAEVADLPSSQRRDGDLLAVRLTGPRTSGRPAAVPVLRVGPPPPADTAPVGVLASAALQRRLGGEDQIVVRVRDLPTPLQAQVVGTIDAFPPNAPGGDLVLADLPTIAALAFAADGRAVPAEQLLMAVEAADPDVADDVRATGLLVRAPLDRAAILARARLDPLAASLLAGLSLTACGAGIAGAVGFGVGARTVWRSRRVEFSALRAMGLTSGQLRRSLLVEHGLLLGYAMVAGLGAGVVLGIAFVPASLPVGILAARVVVPWGAVALFVVLLAGLVAGAGVVLGGRGPDLAGALRQGDDDA